MRRFFSLFLFFIFLMGGAVCGFAVDVPDPDPGVGDASFDIPVADPVEDPVVDPVADPVEDPPMVDEVVSGEVGEGNLFDDSLPGETAGTAGSSIDGSGTGDEFFDSLSVGELTINAESVLLSVPEENEYPSGAPLLGGLYMELETVELGRILVYVPASYQYKSFTKNTAGRPVNITASTITGYCWDTYDYNVRWSSFGQAQYRRISSGSSYSYADLTVTDVLNTNVVFVEANEDLPVVPDSDILQVVVIFLLGGMLLCLFMRRL